MICVAWACSDVVSARPSPSAEQASLESPSNAPQETLSSAETSDQSSGPSEERPAEDIEAGAEAHPADVESSPGALADHPSLLLRTIGSSRGFVFKRASTHTVIAREDGTGVTICRKPAALGCERLEGATLASGFPDTAADVPLVPVHVDGQRRLLAAPATGACWILDDPRAGIAPPLRLSSPWLPNVEAHNRDHEAKNELWSQVRQGPVSDAPALTPVDTPAWVRPFHRRDLEGFQVAMLARRGPQRLIAVERVKRDDLWFEMLRTRVVARDAGGLWRTSPALPGRIRSGTFADDWEPAAVFVAFTHEDDYNNQGSARDSVYGMTVRLLALRAGDDFLDAAGGIDIGANLFTRITGTRSRIWRWWNDVIVTAPHEVEFRRAYAYSADFSRRTFLQSNEAPFTEIRGISPRPVRPGPTGVYQWVHGRFVRKSSD